jgi:ParB family chromosome partitioning protein
MRKALGKGIDALITRVQDDSESVKKIPINNILPNRMQPRQDFSEDSIKELAMSIKQHGLAQPILVTEFENGKYEIIAGERRYRACKYLNMSEIDAIVKKSINEEKKLALALIENLQREDLNPIEEAMAYKKLMSNYNMTQSQIAEYCGKSKYTISNTLRLLELDEKIISALKNSLITEGHARALLSVADLQERNRLFERIVAEKLTVRDIENYSKTDGKQKTYSRKSHSKKLPEIVEAERELEKILGSKVEINCGADPRAGKIIIHYYSLDDYSKVINKLKA